MQIERDPNFKDEWRAYENNREYSIAVRHSVYGPHWIVRVRIAAKGDKPYWRHIRSWQRFAGAVREFENRQARAT